MLIAGATRTGSRRTATPSATACAIRVSVSERKVGSRAVRLIPREEAGSTGPQRRWRLSPVKWTNRVWPCAERSFGRFSQAREGEACWHDHVCGGTTR